MLARCRVARSLWRCLGVAGLAGGLLGRVHLIVQGLHTLTQVAARPGLATDLDAAAQFFGMPKTLVHIGPQLPLALAVAGNGPPSGLQRALVHRAKVQHGLQHGLLLGHTHREAVVAQERSKTGQSL